MTTPSAEMLRAQIKHAGEMIAMLEAGRTEHGEGAPRDRPTPLSAELLEEYRGVMATCQAMLDAMGKPENGETPS